MNILIVCGGTGGHLFPGIAVGEELLKRHHHVLLAVSKKEIDQKATQNVVGFLIETLPAVAWKGWKIGRVARFILGMAKSMIQTCRIFRKFHPDVILGMGGFSSVAPSFLAWKRKTPLCVHESNVIPGKANRLLSKLTSVVAIGFESARNQFPKSHVIWTGTPIRSVLRIRKDPAQAREYLGFSKQKRVVLVMGGSQGARGLNRLVVNAASRISSIDIQWLHLTGAEDESDIQKIYASAGKAAKVSAFCHEMEFWYAASDLIIARAGASSLAEIAAWSLPSILIPYPFAADQHQLANARHFVNAGAAKMWEERDCTPEGLATEIQAILVDENCRRKMADAARKLSCDNAHQNLADVIEQLGQRI